MIQANELRIGNLVNMTCDNASFNARIYVGDFMDINMGYKLVDPIPLTEEWLLKFGFIESETCFKKGFLMFRFYESGLFIPNIGSVEMKEVKYVHQLQNLYFALTGSELVLKPIAPEAK